MDCLKLIKVLFLLAIINLSALNERRNLLVSSLENGLARTPPMGWISWVRFTCDTDCTGHNKLNCISYSLYERMAKAMKEKGFVDLGYQYVNIDDCWSELERDPSTKQLVPHKERFNGPEGIKKLASTLRELNVKLGIYGDCGTLTCAKYPAQLAKYDSDDGNYFSLDAETFYSWGVESFKFDGCYISPNKSEQICPGMSKALTEARKNNNPILLTCEWPTYMGWPRGSNKAVPINWDLAKQSCNLWRHFDDIYDSWISIEAIIDFSVAMQDIILKYHGPGGWFDPDQIIVGGFGLSHDQARAHMVLWSLWSAPLFMSNDIEKLDQRDIDLLQNRDLIAVNQDPLGIWAQMVLEDGQTVWSTGKLQVFVKAIRPTQQETKSQLFCPDFVIAYLYRGQLGNTLNFSINLKEILINSKRVIEEASNRQTHPDWAQKCMDRINGTNPENLIKGFHVEDLLDRLVDSEQNLNLHDDLKLVVNPTGIRVVKLTESV